MAIVRVVEGGNEDDRVRDVEVGIAGGQALAFEVDGRRHRQRDDLVRIACKIARGVQARKVFSQWQVILVAGVWFDSGDDLIFCDEAGDVVDVAMRVIARAATIQPEHLLDAEVLTKGILKLLARDAGVTLLDV